jgi:rhodanese-related sulfurtransferase
MRLINTIVIAGILASGIFAAEFIPYHKLADNLIAENVKNGWRASTDDVKKALKSKDTAVVDVRTDIEWAGAHIQGTFRVGRQSPEKAVANFVLDDDDKLVKDKLIVVCNTTHRASIQAAIFRRMGFTEVKIYPIDEWIDECNPVVTKYSRQQYTEGKDHKFGEFYAEGCQKKK